MYVQVNVRIQLFQPNILPLVRRSNQQSGSLGPRLRGPRYQHDSRRSSRTGHAPLTPATCHTHTSNSTRGTFNNRKRSPSTVATTGQPKSCRNNHNFPISKLPQRAGCQGPLPCRHCQTKFGKRRFTECRNFTKTVARFPNCSRQKSAQRATNNINGHSKFLGTPCCEWKENSSEPTDRLDCGFKSRSSGQQQLAPTPTPDATLSVTIHCT